MEKNTIVLLAGKETITKKEFKNFERGSAIWGYTQVPTEIKRWSMDQKEEAEKELANYRCKYLLSPENVEITEYALMYCVCDDEGYFVEGADYDLAKEKDGDMREWKFINGIKVCEDEHDYDLHKFRVYDLIFMDNYRFLGYIYPDSIEDMEECIAKLDAGEDPITGSWEDGCGNGCSLDGWGRRNLSCYFSQQYVYAVFPYDARDIDTSRDEEEYDIRCIKTVTLEELKNSEDEDERDRAEEIEGLTSYYQPEDDDKIRVYEGKIYERCLSEPYDCTIYVPEFWC